MEGRRAESEDGHTAPSAGRGQSLCCPLPHFWASLPILLMDIPPLGHQCYLPSRDKGEMRRFCSFSEVSSFVRSVQIHPHCTGQKFSSPKCLGCAACNSIFHCLFWPQQASQAPSLPAPVSVCKAQALTSGGQLPLCPEDITIYWASLNLMPYSFFLSVHLSPLYINIRKRASTFYLSPSI